MFPKIHHGLPSLQKPTIPNGTKECWPTIGLHKGPPHTKIYKTHTHTQHTHKHICLLTYTHGLISNIWTCDIHIRPIRIQVRIKAIMKRKACALNTCVRSSHSRLLSFLFTFSRTQINSSPLRLWTIFMMVICKLLETNRRPLILQNLTTYVVV